MAWMNEWILVFTSYHSILTMAAQKVLHKFEVKHFKPAPYSGKGSWIFMSHDDQHLLSSFFVCYCHVRGTKYHMSPTP